MKDELRTVIEELRAVYRSLSAERQSEMISEFRKLADSEADEQVRNFYIKLIELLEKEKKENV